MRFIFAIFIIHLSLSLSAQLKIVKDNIACLYGLKHVSGEWIIKPEYTLITGLTNPYNQYILLKDNKYGLADFDGRIILKPTYNYIYAFGGTMEYYSYTNGKSYGVLDKNGEIVIEAGKYERITLLENQFLRCTKKNDIYLYHKNQLLNKKPCQEVSFYRNGKLFVILDYQKKKNSTKIILEQTEKFDTAYIIKNGLIRPYNSYSIITKKDSTLVYDVNKNLIAAIPFEYIEYSSLNFSQITPSTTYIFLKNKKYGIANIKGEILVQPIYHGIHEFHPQIPATKYFIQENNLIGFMNDSFQVTLPPKYLMKSIGGMTNLMFLTQKNKIAIFNLEGKQLTPFSFTHITDDYNQFLYDSSGIYRLMNTPDKNDTSLMSGHLQKGEFIIKLGQYDIYKFNGYLFPFFPNGTDFNILRYSSVTLTKTGYILYLNYRPINYDLTGKEIIKEQAPVEVKAPPKYPTRYLDNYEYAIVKIGDKYGVTLRDELIVPAEFEIIIPAEGYDENYIWIKKGKNEDCKFVSPMADNWYLCHYNGEVVVDFAFDLPVFIHSQPTIVYVDNRCGLFDFNNKKFIIDPKYDYINPSFGIANHSLLFDFDKNFYVIKNDGTFVSEKKWNCMMITNRHVSQLKLPIIPIKYYSYFQILMNEKDTLAISENGDTTSNSNFIKELIYKGNISYGNDPYNNHLNSNIITYHICNFTPSLFNTKPSDCPQHDQYPLILEEVLEFLMKNKNYDFKFKNELQYINTGITITNINGNTIVADFTFKNEVKQTKKSIINIKFCNDNYVSYTHNNDNYHKLYVNLYRSYGYLFEFSLKDIFSPEVNIEDAMIILLTEAIYNRDDLFLNCHDPATIFDRTGRIFFFDETGLHFKLQDESREWKEIIITWGKLQKYAPEKGIVNDFLRATQ